MIRTAKDIRTAYDYDPSLPLAVKKSPFPTPEYVITGMYDSIFSCPLEIDMHVPVPLPESGTAFPLERLEVYPPNTPTDLSNCSINHAYNVLILWCAVQSFWYYNMGRRMVTDQEFDYIKDVLRSMENDDMATGLGGVSAEVRSEACPLGYSPTKRRRNPCLWIPSRYPEIVQRMFNGYPLNRQDPHYKRFLESYRSCMERARLYRERCFPPKPPAFKPKSFHKSP